MDDALTQFDETTSTEAFSLQNAKLLRVSLRDVTIQAKLGSMVAYQGDVRFEHAGAGGLGRMIKKAATGEGQSLMKVSGTGEVFLAETAQEIHVLHLQDDKVTVNGANLLAFDAGIDWSIERMQGASAMMGGGLYNTALQGTGAVAILSDGPPVRLDVGSAPTFADPQAAITWSSGVTTSIKVDSGGMRSMLRGGSGESVQMAFGGTGWVLVQPSEGRPVPPATGAAQGGLGGLLKG
ncbi:MAG: hypothetical protein JWO90_1788 [Solirubrobacterales bacterium]|jgi:uncharacterized protein (AIM24 family)|nr:hypothetical protein [Solirubrobacterales bacterium]